MNNFLDILADLAATAAGIVCEYARMLASIALVVAMLVGWNKVLHHVVAEQASQAAIFDQLTKPLPTGASIAQQPSPPTQWTTLQ